MDTRAIREGQLEGIIKDAIECSCNRFFLLNSFRITVPEDYKHGTQLHSFAEYSNGERFYYYNSDISDEHYKNATQKLVPGKTYMVNIFGIKERVTSEDCMNFLITQKAILVGAQGISLTRQLKKEEFPTGKATLSFDQKDALWEDADGNRRVPSVDARSGGGWNFHLGYFEFDWHDGLCLLCFCDLPADKAGK